MFNNSFLRNSLYLEGDVKYLRFYVYHFIVFPLQNTVEGC